MLGGPCRWPRRHHRGASPSHVNGSLSAGIGDGTLMWFQPLFLPAEVSSPVFCSGSRALKARRVN